MNQHPLANQNPAFTSTLGCSPFLSLFSLIPFLLSFFLSFSFSVSRLLLSSSQILCTLFFHRSLSLSIYFLSLSFLCSLSLPVCLWLRHRAPHSLNTPLFLSLYLCIHLPLSIPIYNSQVFIFFSPPLSLSSIFHHHLLNLFLPPPIPSLFLSSSLFKSSSFSLLSPPWYFSNFPDPSFHLSLVSFSCSYPFDSSPFFIPPFPLSVLFLCVSFIFIHLSSSLLPTYPSLSLPLSCPPIPLSPSLAFLYFQFSYTSLFVISPNFLSLIFPVLTPLSLTLSSPLDPTFTLIPLPLLGPSRFLFLHLFLHLALSLSLSVPSFLS